MYKDKAEDKLGSNNLGSAWDVMKTMGGLQDKSRKRVAFDGFNSDKSLA